MKITQKNKDLFKLLKQGSAKVNPNENEYNLTKQIVTSSQQSVQSKYIGLTQPTKDLFTQQGITSSFMSKEVVEAFQKLLDAIEKVNSHSWFIINEFSQRVAICYSYHNNLKFLDDTYTKEHPPFPETFEFLSDVGGEILELIANLSRKLKDTWDSLPELPTQDDVVRVSNETKEFTAQAVDLAVHTVTQIDRDTKWIQTMVDSNTNGWIAKVLPTWNTEDTLTPTIDIIFSQGVKDILNRPE